MEIGILLWFQESVRQPWLTPIMEFISFLGKGGWFFVASSLLLCCFKKTRKLGVCLCMAIILQTIFINGLLKPIVARTRPYITYVDVLHLIGPMENDYSFPSGHTGVTAAWAFAIYFGLEKKKWGILAILLVVLMGISRMYLGFHYPSDVLAAFIIGGACGYFGCWISKKYIHPKMKE